MTFARVRRPTPAGVMTFARVQNAGRRVTGGAYKPHAPHQSRIFLHLQRRHWRMLTRTSRTSFDRWAQSQEPDTGWRCSHSAEAAPSVRNLACGEARAMHGAHSSQVPDAARKKTSSHNPDAAREKTSILFRRYAREDEGAIGSSASSSLTQSSSSARRVCQAA